MIKKITIIISLFSIINFWLYSQAALVISPGVGLYNNFVGEDRETGLAVPLELKFFFTKNVKRQFGLLLGSSYKSGKKNDKLDFPVGIILKTLPFSSFQSEISTGGIIEHSIGGKTDIFFNMITGLGYIINDFFAINYRAHFSFKEKFEISNQITFDFFILFGNNSEKITN